MFEHAVFCKFCSLLRSAMMSPREVINEQTLPSIMSCIGDVVVQWIERQTASVVVPGSKLGIS